MSGVSEREFFQRNLVENIKTKLDILRLHVENANGNALSNSEFFGFLKHFYILSSDLEYSFGLLDNVLCSHIGENANSIWARALKLVRERNTLGGIIRRDELPEDFVELFRKREIVEMPKKYEKPKQFFSTANLSELESRHLALACLIGAWNENNPSDQFVVSRLLGLSFDDWQSKTQELSVREGSPLSLKGTVWYCNERLDLWNALGNYVFKKHLDVFQEIAIEVLTERDPMFDLPPDERYMANMLGKTTKFSAPLRKSIAEGIAMLGNNASAATNCQAAIVHNILTKTFHAADWTLWGSLNGVLSLLAQARPETFLKIVEQEIQSGASSFERLFSQQEKKDPLLGGNYLTGLWWALECIAWEETHLIRACLILAELAQKDPGGKMVNSPFNSLTTILLP